MAHARPSVPWTDRPDAPAPEGTQPGDVRADLVIVGGGYTGLWAAVQALERDPGRRVIVLEAGRVGSGASGRNGGFVAASLTHGIAHGHHTWRDEMPQLVRLGRDNLDAIAAFVAGYGIEADLRLCGKTTVATRAHEVAELGRSAEVHRRYAEEVELLDRERVHADVASPTYLAGLRVRSGYGLVDPARLAWGLARVARALGAQVIEGGRVDGFEADAMRLRVRTTHGTVTADRAIVATNAFPSPLRRIRRFIVPVYDYVLMTEPLSRAQWAALGWHERQGISDGGNFFHYYRPTEDGRILFGGYDAVYYYGGRVERALEQRDESHLTLAEHFFSTFPQLEGLRFSHRWGGAIDSTSRFTPAFGTALDGRVAYAVGYTGLGVASSRFGAAVALDLVDGRETERTSLRMVRRRPMPFPPEPLRWLAVRITQSELARQDRSAGKATVWLRLLDRLGMGFTS